MKKLLSETPNRPLSSREIATILGGVIGCLATFCETKEIGAALEFIYIHKDRYLKLSEVLGQFPEL